MENDYCVTGLQVAAAIVRRDFQAVCPSYTLKDSDQHPKKKANTGQAKHEYVLYRPFCGDVDAVNRYLAASPRAVEVFDLLTSGQPEAQKPGLALLWFMLKRCASAELKQQLADYVLTRLCEHIPALIALGDSALHYLLSTVLECLLTAPDESVRVFLTAFSFHKFLGKHAVRKGACNAFSVSRFYAELVDDGVVQDVGLREFLPQTRNDSCDVDDVVELRHANAKKQLCILLILGLKGFNIIRRSTVLHQIFEHIKQDGLLDSICTIRLFILVMANVISTQCATLSLTLRNAQRSELPENVIAAVAGALSNAIAQITATPNAEHEWMVRLNGTVAATFSEFVTNVRDICDAATLAKVLLKFDATQLTIVEILLPLLKANAQLGRHYMPALRCKFNGALEHISLVKFTTQWFTHIQGLQIKQEEALEYLPSFLNQSFFNSGLLSNNRWARLGTLRMLVALMRFVTSSAGNESCSDIHPAVREHICNTIPDFKTLLNVKPTPKEHTGTDGSNISLNIKNETRIMVSNELRSVVTEESGDVILAIDDDDDITEWLKCLHLYGVFVGIREGRSLYDPCKLLKEKAIIDNANELVAGINSTDDEHVCTKKLRSALQLDMALVDCLFSIGVGEIHKGVALNKVQSVCFNFILRRYTELKAALGRRSWDEPLMQSYKDKCEKYVKQVLQGSGVFPSDPSPWMCAIHSQEDYHIFTKLFNHCMQMPLDTLLGSLTQKEAESPPIKYTCVNCITSAEFDGPLILRLSLEYLLHLCIDSRESLQCESCGNRRVNMVSALRNSGEEGNIDPLQYAKYILRGCRNPSSGTLKGHAKRVIQAFLAKHDIAKEVYDTVKPQKVETIADSASTNALNAEAPCKDTQVLVQDAYLKACLAVIDAIDGLCPDTVFTQQCGRIIIDIISTGQSKLKALSVIKQKWCKDRYAHFVNKCLDMDPLNLYTHLFSILVTLLGDDNRLEIAQSTFEGLEFNDDIRWTQLLYLKCRFASKTEHIMSSVDVKERFMMILRRLCSGHHEDANHKTAAALSVSKLSMVVPPSLLEGQAAELLKQVTEQLIMPEKSCICGDMLQCEFAFIKHMMDLACRLAETLPTSEAGTAVALLQSEPMLKLTDKVCELNRPNYYIGDTIESNLLTSHAKLLRSLLRFRGRGSTSNITFDKVAACRMLEAVKGCYRCSYYGSDLALKDVIMTMVSIVSRIMGDEKSMSIRLPPFQDFACVTGLSSTNGGSTSETNVRESGTTSGNLGTLSHGVSRGWLTMISGFECVSNASNWLCLNTKRVSMTLLRFPYKRESDATDLKSTFRNLAILFPPASRKANNRSDEVFGAITLLNRILGSHSMYMQQLIVGDPYIYDVEYLIPFLTGRLCGMLSDQLYQYKLEFEDIFRDMVIRGVNPDYNHAPNRFAKWFSLSETSDAAERIYAQIQQMQFSVALGEAFSPVLMEQVVRNGVLELCILGLVSQTMRKEALKALGMVTKMLQNMLDAAIVRSAIPGSSGPFKIRRVGLFGVYQLHSLICFLQRCQLYAKSGNDALYVLLASQVVRRVTKPEDPLYQLANKYLLLRFEIKMDDVPLFFECFTVHTANDRPHCLSFILQLLLSSGHLLNDYGFLFRRRVLQQLMSFSLVETTTCEQRVQIYAFMRQCIKKNLGTVDELHSIGLATWVATASQLICDPAFRDEKDLVYSTLMVCQLTLMARDLALATSRQHREATDGNSEISTVKPPLKSQMACDTGCDTKAVHERQIGNTIESNIRDVVATFEALQRVAETWYKILTHIPDDEITYITSDGYHMYVIVLEEGLRNLSQTFLPPSAGAGGTTVSMVLTAANTTKLAIDRINSAIPDSL
ncbi:Nucleolar pre-ribosomal-associated 1, putative [Babesia ovata]|uniref:Nucleolar pre-ribosomal-associated 1, putative n=1 Tax=Babesia ovata TaxID=189622 RepID=A0A2H6KCT4_9APIC|nr:Nucleolar pre-ribosomal-associated 1, putative [Babesia ovata]GBE60769.1 Nucleolar pre-ribosomal-associated 1, putative [Babesia ovata]